MNMSPRVHLPSCLGCRRLHINEERTFEPTLLTCDAFPSGIPRAIRVGEHDHTLPHPGDNGVRFVPLHDEGPSTRVTIDTPPEWVH